MASAVEHWLKDGSLAHVDCADTLWSVQFVSGDREQVAAETFYFDWHLPCRLYRVGVKINVGFGGDLANLLDGLQDAGFVVRHHDGDELGVRAQGAADVVGINQAAAIHGDVGDFASHRFQMLAGVQHRMMLDGRTDYVVSGTGQARDGEVIALGAAAGEDDFRGPAPEQRRHRFACALDCRPRLLPVMVDGRRVAEVLREVRPHGLENLGQHWGGGVVVEIDSAHRRPVLILRR